VVKIG